MFSGRSGSLLLAPRSANQQNRPDAMKLSDGQFGALSTLAQFGPKTAVQIAGPVGMDGKRKLSLQWNVATAATLTKLVDAGLAVVVPGEIERPTDATGRKGRPRRTLTISITEAGRAALAA